MKKKKIIKGKNVSVIRIIEDEPKIIFKGYVKIHKIKGKKHTWKDE